MTFAVGLSLMGVILIAVIHITAGWLHRGSPIRPWWLSAASGMAVAYVFIHLLPELGEVQASWLETYPDRPFTWLERQVYIATLVGLVIALSMNRASGSPDSSRARFWMQTTSFATYNFLVGGFALRIAGVPSFAFGVLAFGAHFLVNDYGMHQRHGRQYDTVGRWILAAAVLCGWLLEYFWKLPVRLSATLLALVAGGVILNVLKDELPEGRQGSFAAFVAGAFVYTLLLLALAHSQEMT